jgi:hypothetical protein
MSSIYLRLLLSLNNVYKFKDFESFYNSKLNSENLLSVKNPLLFSSSISMLDNDDFLSDKYIEAKELCFENKDDESYSTGLILNQFIERPSDFYVLNCIEKNCLFLVFQDKSAERFSSLDCNKKDYPIYKNLIFLLALKFPDINLYTNSDSELRIRFIKPDTPVALFSFYKKKIVDRENVYQINRTWEFQNEEINYKKANFINYDLVDVIRITNNCTMSDGEYMLFSYTRKEDSFIESNTDNWLLQDTFIIKDLYGKDSSIRMFNIEKIYNTKFKVNLIKNWTSGSNNRDVSEEIEYLYDFCEDSKSNEIESRESHKN